MSEAGRRPHRSRALDLYNHATDLVRGSRPNHPCGLPDHGNPKRPQGLLGESLTRFLDWPATYQRGGERLTSESRRSLAGHGQKPRRARPHPCLRPANLDAQGQCQGSDPNTLGRPEAPWRPGRPQGVVGESLIRSVGWPLATQRGRERPLSEFRRRSGRAAWVGVASTPLPQPGDRMAQASGSPGSMGTCHVPSNWPRLRKISSQVIGPFAHALILKAAAGQVRPLVGERVGCGLDFWAYK